MYLRGHRKGGSRHLRKDNVDKNVNPTPKTEHLPTTLRERGGEARLKLSSCYLPWQPLPCSDVYSENNVYFGCVRACNADFVTHEVSCPPHESAKQHFAVTCFAVINTSFLWWFWWFLTEDEFWCQKVFVESIFTNESWLHFTGRRLCDGGK